MTWIILVFAGLFEVVWAVGLKYTHGFTRLVPSLITVGGMLVSFWLLSTAMKSLPLGTAYAVWVGIALSARLLPASCCSGKPSTDCVSLACCSLSRA